MNDKMIEELELSVVFNHDGTIRCVYLDDHRICGGKPYASEGLRFKDFKVRASAIVDIARRHEATEPLAVLADRADLDLIVMRPEPKHDDMWVIDLQHIEEFERFIGKTYSEAESKARAFLMGLPDREGN